MELVSISVRKAENGCIVNCDYEEEVERQPERKGDMPYNSKNYETKTYTAPAELLAMIMESVGEEIETPKKKGLRVIHKR
jgi:hypothetical protein